MKTSIVLFSLCALTVITIGAGLGPARTSATPVLTPASVPAAFDATVHTPIQGPRTVPMRVMPTITVVASSADLAGIDDSAESERSVMLEAAVDSAGNAIVEPLRASLPRARLGNPFYDFGRGDGVPAVAE